MPSFRDDHILVISPGARVTLAQLGLPESFTPAKFRVASRMFPALDEGTWTWTKIREAREGEKVGLLTSVKEEDEGEGEETSEEGETGEEGTAEEGEEGDEESGEGTGEEVESGVEESGEGDSGDEETGQGETGEEETGEEESGEGETGEEGTDEEGTGEEGTEVEGETEGEGTTDEEGTGGEEGTEGEGIEEIEQGGGTERGDVEMVAPGNAETKDTVLGDVNPADGEGARSDDTKPEDPKPEDPNSGDTKSEDAKPESVVPRDVNLDGAEHEGAGLDDAKPDDAILRDAESGDPEQGDAKPEDPNLGGAKLPDAIHGDTKSGDVEPGDAKPGQPKPEDLKPSEASLDPAKLDDTKPEGIKVEDPSGLEKPQATGDVQTAEVEMKPAGDDLGPVASPKPAETRMDRPVDAPEPSPAKDETTPTRSAPKEDVEMMDAPQEASGNVEGDGDGQDGSGEDVGDDEDENGDRDGSGDQDGEEEEGDEDDEEESGDGDDEDEDEDSDGEDESEDGDDDEEEETSEEEEEDEDLEDVYVEDEDDEEGAIWCLKEGKVVDWGCFFALIQHIHETMNPTFHTPILMLCPPSFSSNDKERITQFVFEKLKAPGFVLMDSALAVLWAYGLSTATIIDVGFEKTDVTPIMEFVIQERARETVPGWGGDAMTKHLLKLLPDMKYEEVEQLKKSAICEILYPGTPLPNTASVNTAIAAGNERVRRAAELDKPDVIDEEEGTMNVAAIVASGKTHEFLARREKEKRGEAERKLPNRERETNSFWLVEKKKPGDEHPLDEPMSAVSISAPMLPAMAPASIGAPPSEPAGADPMEITPATTHAVEAGPAATDAMEITPSLPGQSTEQTTTTVAQPSASTTATTTVVTTETTEAANTTVTNTMVTTTTISTVAPAATEAPPPPPPVTAPDEEALRKQKEKERRKEEKRAAAEGLPPIGEDEVRREIEVGVERFLAAECGILQELADAVWRSISKVEDVSRRAELWESLVLVGNGSKIKGFKEALLYTIQSKYIIPPSSATIFSSELPSNLSTPAATGTSTPVPQPPNQSTSHPPNPLLVAATTSNLPLMPHHTHHSSHGQTPTTVKFARPPEYFPEWKDAGFEEAAFLGAQVAAKVLFIVDQGASGGFMTRVDYNEGGPAYIHSV